MDGPAWKQSSGVSVPKTIRHLCFPMVLGKTVKGSFDPPYGSQPTGWEPLQQSVLLGIFSYSYPSITRHLTHSAFISSEKRRYNRTKINYLNSWVLNLKHLDSGIRLTIGPAWTSWVWGNGWLWKNSVSILVDSYSDSHSWAADGGNWKIIKEVLEKNLWVPRVGWEQKRGLPDITRKTGWRVLWGVSALEPGNIFCAPDGGVGVAQKPDVRGSWLGQTDGTCLDQWPKWQEKCLSRTWHGWTKMLSIPWQCFNSPVKLWGEPELVQYIPIIPEWGLPIKVSSLTE